MKEIVLRLNADSLEIFQESIIALLSDDDRIELLRDDDGALIYLRSDDDERLDGVAAAAVNANIEVMPISGVTADSLKLDDALLNQLVALLSGADLPIGAAGISALTPYFPVVPAPDPVPKQTLPCESQRVLADGFGLGTGEAVILLRDPIGAFAQARKAARADALAKAADALKMKAVREKRYQCEDPCSLQFDILFGAPKEDLSGGSSIGPAEVVTRALVRLPWELQAVCRREALATGMVEDSEVIPPDEAAPCEGYQVGGTAVVKDQSASGSNYDFSIVDEVIESALDKAQSMIDQALDKLPHCPRVSCPNEKLQIVLGPMAVRADRRTESGMLLGLLTYYVDAKAEVPWRIILTCSP